MWIFSGILLGAVVTASFNDREACEGKAVILREAKVSGKCQLVVPENGWVSSYGGQNGVITLPTR